jgi:hypothetical protein
VCQGALDELNAGSSAAHADGFAVLTGQASRRHARCWHSCLLRHRHPRGAPPRLDRGEAVLAAFFELRFPGGALAVRLGAPSRAVDRRENCLSQKCSAPSLALAWGAEGNAIGATITRLSERLRS